MIIFSKKETNLKKNGFSYYPKLLSKIDINRFFESTLDLLNSYNDEKKRFKNYLADGQRQPDLQIWSAGHQSRHWPHPQGRDAAWR